MLDRLIRIWKYSKLLEIIINVEDRHFRKKCTNSSFTLLTPNCMAGLIYHRLGEQFCSPTIDLNMQNSDFLKFVNNIDYYINQNLIEYKPSNEKYPIGILKGDTEENDIRINFIHYVSFEDAKEKWERRKKRIHKDNMYVIMCDIDDIYEEDYRKVGYLSDRDLREFEKIECNNKVILTRDKERREPYFKYIKPNYRRLFPLVYMNRDLIGLNGFEKYFDFVSFVNKK